MGLFVVIPHSTEERNMQVQDIMTSDPVCCGGNTTIQEAAKLMAEHSIGALPVLNDAGEPMGIVTDRDICC
ncbi:CBS domain-containing protein, partial [Limimaricola sp. G21655-S1]